MADIINFLANSLTITALVGYLFALWAALVVWTWFDISTRTDNPLYRIGAILLVSTGWLFGFAIYLLLRPDLTIEEARIREIEEAVLTSQTQFLTCPACHYTAREDFAYCPNCSLRLLSECSGCSKPVNVSWNTCPYCGKERKKVVEIKPIEAPEEKAAEEVTPIVAVSADKKGRSLAFFSALTGFLKKRNVKKRVKRSKVKAKRSTFGKDKKGSRATRKKKA